MSELTEPTMSGGQSAATSQQPKNAVEMKPIDSSLKPDVAGPATPAKDDDAAAESAKGKEKERETTTTTGDDTTTTSATITTNPPAAAAAPQDQQQQTKSRSDSLSIDGGDAPPDASLSPDAGAVCNITLLLPTGARHPYKIDEKYLSKRNVEVPERTETGKKDPFSISVYKLKELILREWREEWDGKPASPSSIRLIHFGKLLEDKEQLKKYQFSAEAPNVVHMSVRPAEMMEEEEAGKGKSGGRDGRNREGGGGCCVIL